MINKNYTLLWWGQFVSQVGNRLYLMALSWYIIAELNNPSGLFLLFIISSLPSLLFGAFLGPCVEKWRKKYILIGSDTINGILTGILSLLIFYGISNMILIYAICFLISCTNLVFNPAVNSLMPNILKSSDLQRGMSYMKMITFLGQILGAAIGGMLVGFLGVYLTILVNSISFFLSAMSELFISCKESINKVSGNYFQQIKGGIEYVLTNQMIRKVITVAICCNLFIPVIIVYIPILIKNELGLGALEYGVADAMIPMGSVLISFLLARSIKQKSPLNALTIGLGAAAIACLLISLFSNYWIILIALFIYGISVNYININVITYFIKSVDAEYRGRFFSILESFSYASISLSYVLATIFMNLTKSTSALIINSLGLFACAAIALIWSSQLKIKSGNNTKTEKYA